MNDYLQTLKAIAALADAVGFDLEHGAWFAEPLTLEQMQAGLALRLFEFFMSVKAAH